MIIKINDLILKDVLLTEDDTKISIVLPEHIDMIDVLKSVREGVTIDIMGDNDESVNKIKGEFISAIILNSNGFRTLQLFKKTNKIDVSALLKPISVMFVQMAQDGTLDDVTISEHPTLFIEWTENWTGKAGTIVRENDKLYRSIHDVTNVAQNTRPSETPAMWTRIGNPEEEYPEWVQPIGSHDAYNINDKTSHNNKKWVSGVDGNVWEPGVYGWQEVAE